jgi:hypothetical protein
MSGQEETPSPVLGAGAGAAVQSDAVSHYHWMTGAQFLNAVTWARSLSGLDPAAGDAGRDDADEQLPLPGGPGLDARPFG